MAEISRETVYRLGKLVLMNAGVQNTGGILTPLTKNYSYEDIVNALGVVTHDRPVDAVPYLKAVLKGKEKKETVPVAGGQWSSVRRSCGWLAGVRRDRDVRQHNRTRW